MSVREWGRYRLQGASSRTAYGWVIRTPLGIVLVDSWDEDFGRGTLYETVVNGAVRYGREDVARGRTGAAIVAHRWIKSLHAEVSNG